MVKGRVTVARPLNERCHLRSYGTRIYAEGTGRSHPVSLKVGLTPESDQVIRLLGALITFRYLKYFKFVIIIRSHILFGSQSFEHG